MDEEIALRIDLQYDALLIRLVKTFVYYGFCQSTFPAGEGLGFDRLLGL